MEAHTDSELNIPPAAMIWGIVLVLLTPFFLIPTWLLYKHKDEHPINCRSPLLACIGCFALYCDSIMNICIQIL